MEKRGLQFAAGPHDNPDQRIAEDIRIATESAIALAHTLVFSLLTIVVFIGILWTVSGSIALPGTDAHVPGYGDVPVQAVAGATTLGALMQAAPRPIASRRMLPCSPSARIRASAGCTTARLVGGIESREQARVMQRVLARINPRALRARAPSPAVAA